MLPIPKSSLIKLLAWRHKISLELHHRTVATVSGAMTSPLHYLDGQRVEPANTNTAHDMPILEPSTGRVLCTTRSASLDDVDQAVTSSRRALKVWSACAGAERAQVLYRAAQLIKVHSEELAKVEVHDTGKPIWEARADIDGCADTLEYFAGLARTINGEHITLPAGNFAYTRREPLGVCGGIGAWNYPFQMAIFKSAPALVCGNTMVFKPSPLTPLTAVMMAEIYSEAGLPSGSFNVVQGGADTGEFLSNHPDVAKMSFTGSVPSGSMVMQACGRGIKHVTLELGGKSPVIVFGDCDLENAVKGTMMANFLNQGQVCSNGTRVYVQRSIWQPFIDRLVARTKAMTIGDPFAEETRVGAMISQDQAKKVLSYLEVAKQQGASLLCGGSRVVPSDPSLRDGYYLSPCVVVDVHDDMAIAREEVFGSVACVFPFDSEEEVIRRANDTQFGLAGGVFTKDLCRAHRVAAAMEAGNLYINNYNLYPPELPFGGYKHSGIGRENGTVTIGQYTQVKTVYVEMGDVDCPL